MKTSAISIAEQGVPVTAIPGKLTLRFVLPVSLLIIVISTLLSVVITRIARERLTLALEERARSLADDLAYNSELGVLTAQQDLLSGFVNGILRQDDILYVQILESNNKILVQKEKPQYKGILRERNEAKILSSDPQSNTVQLNFPSHSFDVLEVSSPVFTIKKERSREEIGLEPLQSEKAAVRELRKIGLVRIGLTTARIGKTIDSFIKTIAILTLITIILIALVVGLSIFRVVIRPVRNLAFSMQKVTGGDLAIQVKVKGDDEIAQLTQSFNTMAASLKAAHDELEARVVERTKDLQQEIGVRKQAEERITKLNYDLRKRATELQEAVGQLESFSYSISHDLRAPLRAIDGYSRMILEEYDEKVDDEGKRLLRVIRNNATTMGQLIDDLLAFSRLGRQEVKQSLIGVQELAATVFEELRADAGDRKIDFRLGKLPDAYGDLAMLRQVFANLLGNAIKFTARREVASIEAGGHVESAENVYFIKDNGIGFDMEYSGKLFGVFRRLSNAANFEGTGVGLAIVHGIIQKHGGRVWAEGELDAGSVFYFTLPRRRSER